MVKVSNYSGQVEEGRRPARKRLRSRLAVLFGFGAMGLMVLGLCPGCGSDSTPKGAVQGKDAKPAASAKAAKPQAPTAMLMDQGGTAPKNLQQQPNPQLLEVFPGMTREALEAKLAENRKKHLSMRQEVFPGITQEALDAKLAENRKKHLSKRQEVFPGITQEELDAKIAANRQKHNPNQILLPGAGTQADYDAARQQAKPDPRKMMPQPRGK